MPKYRKTALIEAEQWTGENTREIYRFIYGEYPNLRTFVGQDKWDIFCFRSKELGLRITTLEDGPFGEAKHIASIGDWIAKGPDGECWPIKPDIFAQTYELVEE